MMSKRKRGRGHPVDHRDHHDALMRELARDFDAEHRREEDRLRAAAGTSVKVLSDEEVRAMIRQADFATNYRRSWDRNR